MIINNKLFFKCLIKIANCPQGTFGVHNGQLL